VHADHWIVFDVFGNLRLEIGKKATARRDDRHAREHGGDENCFSLDQEGIQKKLG